jgi:hypothetical protein
MQNRRLRVALDSLRELELGKHFDHYRPERHYMRGPGPKWYAKHDGVPAQAAEPENHGALLALWAVPAVAIALIVAAVALT